MTLTPTIRVWLSKYGGIKSSVREQRICGFCNFYISYGVCADCGGVVAAVVVSGLRFANVLVTAFFTWYLYAVYDKTHSVEPHCNEFPVVAP